MNQKTKKLTVVAMLCAVAYVVMAVGRIPIVMFLKYDPKDIVINIGGLIYGPLYAFVISAVVSVVEMFTLSDTGPIGLVMNILSSSVYACITAAFYKKHRTLKGAATGMVIGVVTATICMLLWNYFITPIYMGYPREAVGEMLLPVFLPFNLFKYSVNSVLTVLLYKHIVTALRKTGLVETSGTVGKTQVKASVILVCILLLATCIFGALILSGKI